MEESDNIICLLCSSVIYYLDGKERFFNHLKNQHDAFLNHNLIMAMNFLEKETLAGIEKQFDNWYDIEIRADFVIGDENGVKIEDKDTIDDSDVKSPDLNNDVIDASDIKLPDLNNENVIIKYLCDLCDKEYSSEDFLKKHKCNGQKTNDKIINNQIFKEHNIKTEKVPKLQETNADTSNPERKLVVKSKCNSSEQVTPVESIQDEKQNPKEAEKKYFCNNCNKQYMTENHLKKHTCSARFKNTLNGKARNNKGLGGLYGKTFPCSMCKKEFTAVFFLGKHIVNFDHGRRKTREKPDHTRIAEYLDKVGVGELTEEEEEELKKTYPVPEAN